MTNENINNTPTVTIELSEYMALIQCATDFENLRKALYLSAKLNYNKTGLKFDEDIVGVMLRIIDGERYERKFADLKAAEQEA